jgi:peroxiredoxin
VTAPDFTLPDLDGTPVSLSDFRDKMNVLLVFNRGFA